MKSQSVEMPVTEYTLSLTCRQIPWSQVRTVLDQECIIQERGPGGFRPFLVSYHALAL